MADDGATTKTEDDETSEGAAKETDSSEREADDERDSDDKDDGDEDAKSDEHTCEECGAPMTSEVVDFKISENSRWAEMGGSGDVQYAEVCSNPDCPTNGGDGESERESESEGTDD